VAVGTSAVFGALHWIITQRSIHVILAHKPLDLRRGKPISTGTIGNAFRSARKQAGLAQEQLAEMADIHRQWLGRWERNRALPTEAQWAKLRGFLKLLTGLER